MNQDTIKSLGLSFAKLLSYTYAGFLPVVLFIILNPVDFDQLPIPVSWELVAVAAIVLGAGIHVFHRTLLVPIHHYLSSLLWWVVERGIRWVVEKRFRRPVAKTLIPTIWLGTLDSPVNFFWRIPAYSAIRHSEPFKDMEDRSWDLIHTELGLVLLTGEAFVAGALALKFFKDEFEPLFGINSIFLAVAGVALILGTTIAAYFQHSHECRLFRARKDKVIQILEETGFIRTHLVGFASMFEDIVERLGGEITTIIIQGRPHEEDNYSESEVEQQSRTAPHSKPPAEFVEVVSHKLSEERIPSYLRCYWVTWVYQLVTKQRSTAQIVDDFELVGLPLLTQHLNAGDPDTFGFWGRLVS